MAEATDRLRRITPSDARTLADFLAAMPEGDRTFFKEPTDLESVERWLQDDRSLRWLLVDGGDRPIAYLAIIPGVGWSSHVGELRLLVAPASRRRGIGRTLSRHGLAEGLRLGLRKLVVEVAADKEGDLQMFTAIGFRAEALLTDQIRDRSGRFGDLVILSHDVEDVGASIEVLGIDREGAPDGGGAREGGS